MIVGREGHASLKGLRLIQERCRSSFALFFSSSGEHSSRLDRPPSAAATDAELGAFSWSSSASSTAPAHSEGMDLRDDDVDRLSGAPLARQGLRRPQLAGGRGDREIIVLPPQAGTLRVDLLLCDRVSDAASGCASDGAASARTPPPASAARRPGPPGLPRPWPASGMARRRVQRRPVVSSPGAEAGARSRPRGWSMASHRALAAGSRVAGRAAPRSVSTRAMLRQAARRQGQEDGTGPDRGQDSRAARAARSVRPSREPRLGSSAALGRPEMPRPGRSPICCSWSRCRPHRASTGRCRGRAGRSAPDAERSDNNIR